MIQFQSPTVEVMFYILGAVAAGLLLLIGLRLGRWVGNLSANKLIAAREQELFTAQKGFKTLYEKEVDELKQTNAALAERVKSLEQRVEEYRKKAAGFGGLFNTGGKRADAMYALLLENEAMEEALYAQNEKLKQERTDSLKEQLRATSYRRVLMSQLLNDDRIKGYVAEILDDEKRLPSAEPSHPAAAQLPADAASSQSA